MRHEVATGPLGPKLTEGTDSRMRKPGTNEGCKSLKHTDVLFLVFFSFLTIRINKRLWCIRTKSKCTGLNT